MGLLGWLWSHMLLIIFIAATAAFGISTIVLAIDNNDLKDQLDAASTSAPGLTTETPATTEPPTMEEWRLPANVIPESYDLILIPDLDTGLFSGTVTITVKVENNGNDIRLHSNKLEIDSVVVDGIDTTHSLDTQHELIIINKMVSLETSKTHEIVIKFNGDMTNRIVGLYQSTYTNEDGEPV